MKHPLSATAESYRYLREHLNSRIASVPDGGAVLLVTSAKADDGCTSVAANLAVALAESGAKVVLVDADLSHLSLGTVFDAGRRPGWSDLLARRASLDEVAIPVPGVAGLRLVTAGDVTIRPRSTATPGWPRRSPTCGRRRMSSSSTAPRSSRLRTRSHSPARATS